MKLPRSTVVLSTNLLNAFYMHRERGNIGLTEVNRDCRFNRYTCTGAHNCSKPKYTEQSLNSNRKDKSSKAKVQKRSWVVLKCVTENVNIFVLYWLWCKGKYPKEKKKSHCSMEICTYCYNFKNELDKGIRRQKPKSHDYSLQILCEIQTVM